MLLRYPCLDHDPKEDGKDGLLLTYFYIFRTKMLPASLDTVIIDLTFKAFVGLSSFGKFVQLVISPFLIFDVPRSW